MIRTKAQKQQVVTALADRLRRAPTVYITDFTGLDVAKLTQLRRRLRAAGVEYVVVKNTLALRALGDARVPGLEPHLAGPTGLVLGGADPVAAAKGKWEMGGGGGRSPSPGGGELGGFLSGQG